MNAPINDGGPAFPKDQERGTHGDVIEHAWPGMSLRDYFAAQAMQGWLASYAGTVSEPVPDMLATFCYELADAMLKARAS